MSEDFVAQVKELTKQAEGALGIDNELAEELANKILTQSRSTGFKLGEENALFLLGAADYYRSRYVTALKWAELAKNSALNSGNRNLAFRVASMIGGIHDSRGNLEAALKAGLESLTIAEEDASLGKQAIACLNLGIHFREGGEYDKSLEYLTKSYEFEKQTPTQDRLAWILSVIGSVWIMKNEYARALDYLEQSLVLTEQVNKDAIRPDVLNNLGVVHVRLGNFKEADYYHNEALALRRKLGDLGNVCGSLVNLGLLAHEQGDFLTAIAKYKEALSISIELGSRKNEARVNGFLSDSFEAIGDFKSALDHSRQLTKLTDELKSGAMEEMEQRIRAESETERVRTEAELHRVREYELAEAQRIANLGSWQYDLNTRIFVGSVEFCRLLGLDKGETHATFDRFLLRFHPDDRDQFKQSFDISINRRTALDIVIRGMNDKGSRAAAYHLIGQWGNPTESGNAQFSGTLQDVSLQLEADDVRHEKERLQGMLEMAGAFSHEINQPLQVITTTADLIQQVYGEKADLVAHVKRILNAIDRIHDISSRLTSVSKYRTKEYVKGVRIMDLGRDVQQDTGG